MKRAALIMSLTIPILLATCVSIDVKPSAKGGTSWYKVENVISGDTIFVNGVGKIKYIGVNAPGRLRFDESSESLWNKSLEANRRLVEGNWVRFEMDKRREDSNGRILAYVFVQQDYREEVFVNGEILRLGMARLEESTVNIKYIKRLEALENRARNAQIGVWSEQ